jgi:hypothetical protein
MAETITTDGNTYVKRNPWGVLGLSIITLWIYWFYWYFKVNDEARTYLRDESINPGVSLLAVLIGWVLIVPPFVSAYHTAQRVERIQEQAGTGRRISPGIAIVLYIFIGIFYGWYLQSELNAAWDQAQTRDALPRAP